MGRHALYVRLLSKFRREYEHFGARFAAARDGADPSAAMRAAHTLKGSAGTIGALDVQHAAGVLEQACQDGVAGDALASLVAATEAALAPVLAGLRAANLQGDDEAQAELGQPLMAELQPQIEALTLLLKDGDVDALAAIEEMTARTADAATLAYLGRVAALVADCDFDAALAALGQSAD